MNPSIILAIETSCDETAAAVIKDGKIKSSILLTQQIHSVYGGVVPEMAARAHTEHIAKVVERALTEAGIKKEKLTAIAFTKGPGLLGALLVGKSFAEGLGKALGIPIIGVHHIAAHLLVNFLNHPAPSFPFLGLVVSGGHTQLVWVKEVDQFFKLGETKDDAVGEAFDKCAKMMGLPYPGGPFIDLYAKKGCSKTFSFPKAKMEGLNFSFSGIKTAYKYFLEKRTAADPAFIKKNKYHLAASLQDRLVAMLVEKTEKAIRLTKSKFLVVGGGVAANSQLRDRLQLIGREQNLQVYIPPNSYCVDNAAMIAITAHLQLLKKKPIAAARVEPRIPFPSGRDLFGKSEKSK